MHSDIIGSYEAPVTIPNPQSSNRAVSRFTSRNVSTRFDRQRKLTEFNRCTYKSTTRGFFAMVNANKFKGTQRTHIPFHRRTRLSGRQFGFKLKTLVHARMRERRSWKVSPANRGSAWIPIRYFLTSMLNVIMASTSANLDRVNNWRGYRIYNSTCLRPMHDRAPIANGANAFLGQSPRNLSGWNSSGSFQYLARRVSVADQSLKETMLRF
jgi:hypothetical protein